MVNLHENVLLHRNKPVGVVARHIAIGVGVQELDSRAGQIRYRRQRLVRAVLPTKCSVAKSRKKDSLPAST